MVSKKLQTFYGKKGIIPSIILSKVNRDEIIYGAQAINVQVKPYLRKYTKDYDIFTSNPEREAKELEKALDKYFNGNYFYVELAKHKGTFRVKSKIDGEVYADFTQPNKKVPYIIINGKRYVDLKFIIKHIKETLKNKKAKFRWDKDRDALNRIKLSQAKKPLNFGGIFK